MQGMVLDMSKNMFLFRPSPIPRITHRGPKYTRLIRSMCVLRIRDCKKLGESSMIHDENSKCMKLSSDSASASCCMVKLGFL